MITTQAISGVSDDFTIQNISVRVQSLKAPVIAGTTKCTLQLQFDSANGISNYYGTDATLADPAVTFMNLVDGEPGALDYRAVTLSIGQLMAAGGKVTITTTALNSFGKGDYMPLVFLSACYFWDHLSGTFSITTTELKSVLSKRQGYFSPASGS